ncbi:hypothetical protein [Sporosarcina ureae]|uniref:hypothetical protein n=1 Tax=Sporosarcina ureae TaxID=1571 RepID=UPI000A17FAF4|nr:hypothetical protein [Sporosarcina ureae]ARK22261.1 hypothetical protein SporoP32a_12430 [Sporosarcina ureae]
MNPLNKGTQLETTVLNMEDRMDIKVLEELDFLEVIQRVGQEKVEHLLNVQLDAAVCRVKIAEDIEKRITEKEDVEELGLFYHVLVLPKFPASHPMSERVHNALRGTIGVGVSSEEDFTRTHVVELSKRPIVHSMSEVVRSITCEMLPEVKELMNKNNLNEYYMIFNLEVGI